jgi:hypothetical protein
VRWQVIIISVVAACLVAQSSMKPSEVEAFKLRIGWSSMLPPDLSGGVRADWQSLPVALQPTLAGLRKYSESVIFVEPGLMQLRLTWRREPKVVAVGVFVSMDPQQVRAKLISIASQTMRMTIPYVRGPQDLGEMSIRHQSKQGDSLLWVFHNVLVDVDNIGTGLDIVPAAYEIQAFMNRALTPALAAGAPRIDGIQLSPSPVHVGNEVSISVTPAPGTAPGLTSEFRESQPQLLDVKGADTFSSTYLARSPGQTRVDVTLIDKKTLLPPTRGVPVEVLP